MRLHLVLGVAVVAIATAATPRTPATQAPVEPRPRTITVRIHHSKFQPEQIRLPAGAWVRFVVHNEDPIDHEFLVGDDAFQDRHERGTELHHPPRPGEISVDANSVAETTIALGGPARLWYGCHLPGHWDYGMKGRLILGG